MRFSKTIQDVFTDVFVYFILITFAVLCLYPIIYIFSLSISDPVFVRRMEVWLLPKGFSLQSFKLIFDHPYINKSYLNSIFYTLAGTAYSMVLTILGAYVLSRKRLIGRNVIMFGIWFTMVFTGGLVPTYLLVNDLNMINTRWSLIIPTAISQYNLIIMRTSMLEIPDSLEESAKIDGFNAFRIMVNIIIPTSLPVIATVSLFYGVWIWNSYFSALIYLSSKDLYPLQAILRELLVAYTDNFTDLGKMDPRTQTMFTPFGFRAAVVVVSILPMMFVYPFIQKYFVTGIMVGSIKG